jgi:hypothetical protein
MIEETGPLTLKERLTSRLAPAILWRETMKLRLGIDQQPEYTRRTYRMPSLWHGALPAPVQPSEASGLG